MTMTDSNLFSFGALLKTFRTRSHLTQQQLATAIGMHRHAIGRWEQGDYLPESKTLVLELARHLKLDDQETRQLLEASLTALAPHWSVPLQRNPFFIGREGVLDALNAQLGVEQAVVLSQSSILHGLGGIGKTQVALEYAYRHALEYSAVFWITAETDEQIVVSLQRIAEVLQLAEREDRDQQHVVNAIHRWLSTHGKWLLIWDNVEDFEVLHRFLPATRSGTMLITTRRQVLGTLGRGLDLSPMEREEGVRFLLLRAKVLAPGTSDEQMQQFARQMPTQYAVAVELVEAMGGLPLALDQAGAYIEATRCGLPTYLDLFRTRRAALLQKRGEGVHDHLESVSTTFAITIVATAQRHPAVWDFLRICALLQPDAIPEELFRQGGKHLGTTLEIVCGDELEWNQVVSFLCSYSLLARQPEERTLSLHRLVQAVLLDAMTEAQQEEWEQRVIVSLEYVFPAIEPTTWKQCERLLPHVQLCLQRAGNVESSPVLASLVFKAGCYLRARGRYAEADPLFQRALHMREQALGADHPEVATSLLYLAIIHREQGKYAEADPLFQRALHMREQALGADHPEVAFTLNNFALLYWEQGKYVEAEPLFLRALHIREHAMDIDHLQLAYTLDNLALLYKSQGKYAEAEPLFQRSLSIQEREKGLDHPDVAYTLNNIAALCWEQGKYAEAELLFERALHICEKVMGEDHPDTARALNNLACVYQIRNKQTEAETLFQRAVRISEQTLGTEHPMVAQILEDLAELYKDQGKYALAEPLFQRALHIYEQALGTEHPHAARVLNNLARLYGKQGQDAEAEPLFWRALHIREHHLGQHHPETAQTLHDLAGFLQQQGNLNEALPLANRALKVRLQSLGDSHPKTVATQELYAQLIQERVNIQKEIISEHRGEEHNAKEAIRPVDNLSSSENAPLQRFFDTCCELHPHAWCRSSDLWQAYTQWTKEHQERYPLARGAFIRQLKAHGCHADRTTEVRIWRGIAVVKKSI